MLVCILQTVQSAATLFFLNSVADPDLAFLYSYEAWAG